MRACRMTLSMAQGRDSPVRRRSVRAARSRSRTNSVAPTSVPAPQLAAALPQLRGVIASHLFGGSRVVLHAGVAAIAAAVSRPAEIIGEIKVVSVVAGDAERVGSLRMIPADEIDGVGETAASEVIAALSMKPSSLVRGGRALLLKPDSLRTVAISTGTGMPYFCSVRSAADCQLSNQPSFWSKTAQTLLIWLGAVAQAESASSTQTATILLKLDLRIGRRIG